METQKNVSKHSLQDVQTQFGISRSKLYKTLKEQGIKPTKEGRKSYISDTCLTQLQNTLDNTGSDSQKNTGTNTGTENTGLIGHLQEQIEREQEKNEALQNKVEDLTREAGRWEGVAKALEQQNQKLLESSTPEDQSEVIQEAEIVEKPEEKAEEPKPKKRGWFSFFR